MSKKKKKSLLDSRFYRVYFTVLGAALVVILVGTLWLMNYLRGYEAAQPIYVAEDVAKLFENKDFDDLYALDSAAGSISGGDKAFYVKTLSEIAGDKAVAWSEGFTEEENRHKYNVTLDGERFASFVLVPDEQAQASGGHTRWTLGYVTTNVAVEEAPVETAPPEPTPPPAPAAQVRVTAPRDYLVYVDGVQLTAENASISEKAMFEDDFLPEGVNNPVIATYDYGAATETPEVVVTDTFNSPVPLSQTADNTWVAQMTQNTTYQSQYSDAAISLGEKIAKFTSKDGSKDAILKYCAKDSPAREKFNNLSNQYATPHTEIAFQNETVGEFYDLGNGVFTCRVTFDYLLKTKVGVQTDPAAYTFCIIQQDGNGRLYNLLMS